MTETAKAGPEAFQEISNYPIVINKNEEGTCVWQGSTLAVRSSKGLHFFRLSHDNDCIDKKINFKQSFLPSRKSNTSSNLFTERVINSTMRNRDYTEMIIDQTMWPHNPQIVDEMACITSFEWSPPGILPSEDSLLAVLNNIGSVDLYVYEKTKWIHKIEIDSPDTDGRQPIDFADLKDAVHTQASTALCWAPSLAGEKCCYLATAQKNDSIIFWLVQYSNAGITAERQGSIDDGVGEIMSMKWMSLPYNNFILVCSNILGQIILFECTIADNKVEIQGSHMIWADKDYMISKYLQLISIRDKIILICNKHRHILMLMMDKNFKVCGQFMHNINDLRITCIANNNDEIYFTTVNSQIYKINILMQGNNFDVNILLMEYKEASHTTELYGMSFSPNGVLCALLTIDRKISFRKDAMTLNVIFTTTQEKLDSLVTVLLGNSTNMLTNYWDVIELLRYKCMKQKQVPAVSYSKLYDEGCHHIYYLKLYLIFMTFYLNLRKLSKIPAIEDLPEASLDTIKEEIHVIHAESVFMKFNEKRLAEGQLYGLDKETIIGSLNFLEHYCKKNNRELSDILNLDKSQLGDAVCEYTCQGCDELLQGFTCSSNHLNMFCSLTYSPIESYEYLACWWCNSTARIELLPESPKCLICDLSLFVMN